jgi:hypothetical protein
MGYAKFRDSEFAKKSAKQIEIPYNATTTSSSISGQEAVIAKVTWFTRSCDIIPHVSREPFEI